MNKKIQFRWAEEEFARWENVIGATEEEAANHIAYLAGIKCPVPGAARATRAKATQVRPHVWRISTGALIETRETP